MFPRGLFTDAISYRIFTTTKRYSSVKSLQNITKSFYIISYYDIHV